MDNYKLAAQQQLRYNVGKGEITTEQLFTLSIKDLKSLAINLQKEYKKQNDELLLDELLLDETTNEDKVAKLKFDIVYDVLITKREARKMATEAARIKEDNQKIFDIIARKEHANLENLSIDELRAMIK